MKNTLVVFYSRSGYTRRMAERLAALLDADREEIAVAHSRAGIFGFARSILEVLLERPPRIAAPRLDPRNYRTVVIGSPVWAAHVCGPVRAYLLRHAGQLRHVGLFCTQGASGADETLAEMAGLLLPASEETVERGRFPTLALTDREIDAGEWQALDGFVQALQARAAAVAVD